ncbi:MAG: hypothetical protein H6968_20035 [Chromatiaceae bacterium]|nr:hypothetical protein [Chromatiaceae bacterium]
MKTAEFPTIQEAIQEAGGVRQLADRLGYNKSRIYQWLQEGRSELPDLAKFRYAFPGQRSSAVNAE